MHKRKLQLRFGCIWHPWRQHGLGEHPVTAANWRAWRTPTMGTLLSARNA